MRKGFGRKLSWPNLYTIPTSPEGTEKNHEKLTYVVLCPDKDWKLTLLEYYVDHYRHIRQFGKNVSNIICCT
jgi:hypothetical protein